MPIDEAYVEKLRAHIEALNHAYYDLDSPLTDDQTYDKLLRELEEIEEAHPEWRLESSPTQHVGGRADETLAKVRHEVPMECLFHRRVGGGFDQGGPCLSRCLVVCGAQNRRPVGSLRIQKRAFL